MRGAFGKPYGTAARVDIGQASLGRSLLRGHRWIHIEMINGRYIGNNGIWTLFRGMMSLQVLAGLDLLAHQGGEDPIRCGSLEVSIDRRCMGGIGEVQEDG